jgi:hypothetical protein
MTRWGVVFLFVLLMVWPLSGQTKPGDDIRYLVIRTAGGPPDKNHYELAKQVEMADRAPGYAPGLMDIETTEPRSIRYGVHSIWKVRVLRITDSVKDPVSSRDAFYALIYERDPDVRFCGVRYEVHNLPSERRRIEYTDCEDKKRYSFEMTKEWPRPFVIYELEVVDRDALRAVWHRQVEMIKASEEKNKESH